MQTSHFNVAADILISFFSRHFVLTVFSDYLFCVLLNIAMCARHRAGQLGWGRITVLSFEPLQSDFAHSHWPSATNNSAKITCTAD